MNRPSLLSGDGRNLWTTPRDRAFLSVLAARLDSGGPEAAPDPSARLGATTSSVAASPWLCATASSRTLVSVASSGLWTTVSSRTLVSVAAAWLWTTPGGRAFLSVSAVRLDSGGPE